MSVDDQLSLRERKKQATRATIRRAALDLVANRGFAQVTVEDISSAADVSPRTFFNYFPSKEAVILGFGPEQGESIRQRVEMRPAGELPLQAVAAVISEELQEVSDHLVELGGECDEWVERLRVAHADPHVRAAQASHVRLIEQALARGVAARLELGPGGDNRPYCILLAGAAVGTMRAVMTIWARHGGDLPSLTREAFEAISEGLRPPEEI